MTEGKTRLEAARWFFETLVLQTKDFVDLQQVGRWKKDCLETPVRRAGPVPLGQFGFSSLSEQQDYACQCDPSSEIVMYRQMSPVEPPGCQRIHAPVFSEALTTLLCTLQEAPYEDIVIVPRPRLMARSSQARGSQ